MEERQQAGPVAHEKQNTISSAKEEHVKNEGVLEKLQGVLENRQKSHIQPRPASCCSCKKSSYVVRDDSCPPGPPKASAGPGRGVCSSLPN